MAKLATYSADKVTVVIGPHIVTGYADGTFINIEEMSDGAVSVAGADGEVARAMSTDPRKTVTLTVLQTSSTNENATFPVAIKDLRGNSLFASSTAWIKKLSNIELGKEVGAREWIIETADGVMFVGGNQ